MRGNAFDQSQRGRSVTSLLSARYRDIARSRAPFLASLIDTANPRANGVTTAGSRAKRTRNETARVVRQDAKLITESRAWARMRYVTLIIAIVLRIFVSIFSNDFLHRRRIIACTYGAKGKEITSRGRAIIESIATVCDSIDTPARRIRDVMRDADRSEIGLPRSIGALRIARRRSGCESNGKKNQFIVPPQRWHALTLLS